MICFKIISNKYHFTLFRKKDHKIMYKQILFASLLALLSNTEGHATQSSLDFDKEAVEKSRTKSPQLTIKRPKKGNIKRRDEERTDSLSSLNKSREKAIKLSIELEEVFKEIPKSLLTSGNLHSSEDREFLINLMGTAKKLKKTATNHLKILAKSDK